MKFNKCTPEILSGAMIVSWILIFAAGAADIAADNTENVTINLTAKDYVFDATAITVPTGANVTVNFDNMDSGVEHNFAIYETSDGKMPIFVGDEITGPDKTTYNFVAPIKAGTYFFRCDDHPEQMRGDFIIK